MKQELRKVKTESGFTTLRYITRYGYKFKINSSIRHAINMKALNLEKGQNNPVFSTKNLEKMLQVLIEARNKLANPVLTHLTIYLNDTYKVSDITERLRRIKKDDEVRYIWSLENKDGNIHLHLFLIVDIPSSELSNLDEYINTKYNKGLLGCSAVKSVYNKQYSTKDKSIAPYYNLKNEEDFVKSVEYASYATKQTDKDGFPKGIKKFDSSYLSAADKTQQLILENAYMVTEYFTIPSLWNMDNTFRLALTIEKLGNQTNLYWTLRDFSLISNTTPLSFIEQLEDILDCYLKHFIQENKISVHPDDTIVESVEVLPTLHQYKNKTNEIEETIVKESQTQHIEMISNLEDEIREIAESVLLGCLVVKDSSS